MTSGKKRENVIAAASSAIGGIPGHMGRVGEEPFLKIVWTGIVADNMPDMALPDIALAAGLEREGHSSIHGWLSRWRKLDWRVRHGWLVFVEHLMSGGSLQTLHLHMHEMREESIEAAKQRRGK